MTGWKDVLATVGSTLAGASGDCVLEFLKILPEEVTEGRKINLSVCWSLVFIQPFILIVIVLGG